MKQCANCFSTETWIDKNGHECWLRHGDGLICHKCYNKLINNPKRTKECIKEYNDKRPKGFNKKYNDKRPSGFNRKYDIIRNKLKLRFKGLQIVLKEKPRTGYCSICKNNIFDGSCKRTNIHHLEYHDGDPMKDTIELCNSCHRKQHIGQDEYSW